MTQQNPPKPLAPLPGELPPETAALLDGHLDTLRDATADFAPGAALEARLQSALRKKHRAAPFRWFTGFGLGVPAAALTLSLGFAGWFLLMPLIAPMSGMPPAAVSPSGSDAPFIALASAERIALEPSATIVSTTFPRALLAEYGLPVSPERAGEAVRADMLVGSNGLPLALRIIE
jgi:hypothetical protein